MTTFESAATPIVRISPAMPGRVSVIGISFIIAVKKTGVDGEAEDRDHAEEAVVEEEEQRDQDQADQPGLEALVERLLAERRGDGALADQVELDRQRADLQELGEVLRLLDVADAGDLGAGAAVDAVGVLLVVDDRPGDDVAVEDDREGVGLGSRFSWPRWAIRRVIVWKAWRPSSVKSKVTFGWLAWSKVCSGLVRSSPLSSGRSWRTK